MNVGDSVLDLEDNEQFYRDLETRVSLHKINRLSFSWKEPTSKLPNNLFANDNLLDDPDLSIHIDDSKTEDNGSNGKNIIELKANKSQTSCSNNSNKENLLDNNSVRKDTETLNGIVTGIVSTEQKITDTSGEKETENFSKILISFLEQDADGKLVFLHFKKHKCLDKESRGILVRTIIKKFKDDALKAVQVGEILERFYIPTKVLAEIAKIIEETFPGEAACTYFSPYKTENGTTFQTCGALWSNYQYTIGALRNKGLLKPKKGKQSSLESVSLPSTSNKDLVKVALNNLEKGLKLDTLLHDWIATFDERKSLLSISKLSISEYINKFPCLKTEHAQQLIEEDFKKLQTVERSSVFISRWLTIKQVIIKQLELYANRITNRKRKDGNALHDLAFIKLLPALKSEQQDAVVLNLLQLLINCASPSGRKRKDGTSDEFRKYDVQEIRQSFIYNVKIVADLESEIDSLKNVCLARKETFQPTVFVIGELSAISEAYVVLDSQQYKCATTLDAFDFALKLFFALDCSYPKPAYRLWQFLQIAGFEISDEKANKSVKELVGLVTEALKNVKE